jgi:lipid A 3-O-deacylase
LGAWTLRAAGLMLLFILLPGRTYGQSPDANRQKGDWDFSVWGAGETGEENTNSFAEAQIWSAGFQVGKILMHDRGPGLLRGNVEYAFDVMPVFQTYGNQRIWGGGFDPVMFRWNFALHSSRLTPYIASSGGAVFTSSNLPPGNTSSFNAMAKAGGGVYIRTKKRQDFDIGLCWSHISNANRGVRNPEFNGIQLSIAYHWFK